MKSDLWNSELLREERKRRGWSQAKLAEALGVDVTTVRRWERGQVVPYPYHRKKMAALFGKTVEELGWLPSADEEKEKDVLPTEAVSEVVLEASLLTDTVIPEPMDRAKDLLDGDELLDQIERSLSSQALWDSSSIGIRHISTYPPINRLSLNTFLISLIILLSALFVSLDLPTLSSLSLLRVKQGSSSDSKSHGEMAYGPPEYMLTIQNADSSLDKIPQHLRDVFRVVYPQLVNRFALDPASAAKKVVTLAFSSNLSSIAQTNGTTITLNAHWIEQHPTDVGLLTHQLTLTVEQYPPGVPGWFGSGMADYARSVYGPADDEDWSLPGGVQPHESYRQGGGIAARFLRWLELHTRSDIVNQLNHALQRGQSFSAAWHSLTHATVDELWKRYQSQPDVTVTPQQLYALAISGKPLSQSSHQLQGLYNYTYAQNLYLSNFAIQADITITTGSSDAGAGFFIRNNNASWFNVYLFANGGYRVDYQNQPGPFMFSSAVRVGLNQTNRLTVILQKSTIYVYINGQFVTQVDDKRLLSYGTLGPTISDPTSTVLTNVRFEKVQVF